MKAIKYIFWTLFLTIVIGLPTIYFTGGKSILRPPQYDGMFSDHFNGSHFYNKYTVKEEKAKKFWKMRLTEPFEKWPSWVEIKPQAKDKVHDRIDKDNLKVTFINHASILIQTANVNILTDPIWSKRCSPFSYIGPKRVHNPGMKLENLPKIDIILISHDHYDHLDINSLKQLQKKFNPTILVGLGVSKILKDHGIKNTFELDWWDKVQVHQGLDINFTPAEHWSGRGFRDTNTTLWGGYFITTPKYKVYFAGDSAVSPIFKDIRNRYGDPDISFLPIGSFLPRWFMKPSHMSPDEAVFAHKMLRSKKSVGIHWGTFQLSAEAREAPVSELKKANKKYNVPNDEFVVMLPGESMFIKKENN